MANKIDSQRWEVQGVLVAYMFKRPIKGMRGMAFWILDVLHTGSKRYNGAQYLKGIMVI